MTPPPISPLTLGAVFERLTLARLRPSGARSQWIKTSITPLHSIALPGGAGGVGRPPLVLVHGLGSSAASYGALAALAAPAFKAVVAPSAPSHGMSPAHPCVNEPDALFEVWREALDALSEAEPVALLGTSLGGAVALRYALERPARVRALVLCSPAGPQMTPAQIAEVRENFRMGSLGDGARFLSLLFERPPPLTPLLGLAVRATLRAEPVQALLSHLTPSLGLSRAQLSSLQVPTLLFWGGAERVLPAGLLDVYREALPPSLATIVEPPRFSHSPQLERPRELLERTLAWLDALRPPLRTPRTSHDSAALQGV